MRYPLMWKKMVLGLSMWSLGFGGTQFQNPDVEKMWAVSGKVTLHFQQGAHIMAVGELPEKSWFTKCSTTPKKVIPEGTTVRISAFIKPVKSANGKAQGLLKFQWNEAPYEALVQKSFAVGPTGETVSMFYTAPKEIKLGACVLDLHLGSQIQTIEVRGVTMEASDPVQAKGTKISAPATSDTRTLKTVWKPYFPIGAAIDAPPPTPGELAVMVPNFSTLTPENCMKPSLIHPKEGEFRFEKPDALVAWANQQGITVNAHCLVWHSQCPDWFFQDGDKVAGKELVLSRMRDHIAKIAGRYKGKVVSWDVVNEALDDGNGYLRNSKWYQAAGEDFIPEAFFAARKADPGAILVYNDYGNESPRKRQKNLDLIRDLKSRGAPIDAVGIQSHYGLNGILHGEVLQQIEDSLVAYAEAGVKVMITELDVDLVPRKNPGADVSAREAGNDPYPNGLPEEKQQELAEAYGKLFALYRKHADKIARVTFWGYYDGKSWLNGWPWKRTNYPLPWARDLSPKPALTAILDSAK